MAVASFNLKREAAPVATQRNTAHIEQAVTSFNLKREAAPVATKGVKESGRPVFRFQSQTRSRPSCHAVVGGAQALFIPVSISNEKPPQLPQSRTIKEAVVHFKVSISNEKPPQLPRLQ